MGYNILTSGKAIPSNIQREILALVIIALGSTSIQGCEFIQLAISINDGALGTYLLRITEVNSIHVVLGAVLLFFTLLRSSLQNNSFTQTRIYNSSCITYFIILAFRRSYLVTCAFHFL